HEVGVIELSLSPNLVAELSNCLHSGLTAGEYFDRFDAAEKLMLGLEDMPHAPPANGVEDPVGAERELRTSFLQLFDLPGVEEAKLYEATADRVVGDFTGRHAPLVAEVAGRDNRAVDLLRRHQSAGQ